MVGDPSFSFDKSLSLLIVYILLKKKNEKNLCCGSLNVFHFPRLLAIKSRYYFSCTAFENVHRKGRV